MPRSRVLHYSIEITREEAGSRSSIVVEPDRIAQSRASRLGTTTIVTSLESRLP
jgi:hypothetical protein